MNQSVVARPMGLLRPVLGGFNVNVTLKPPRFGASQKPLPMYKPPETDYLCHCLKVTEAEVVDSICQGGASTVEQIRKTTEAGTGCTACVRKIKELLERLRPKKAEQQEKVQP